MKPEHERPGIALEEVLVTPQLAIRPARAPDLASENRAMHELARQMVADPERILERMAELALDLCNAGSAGVSVLETDSPEGPVFRWRALAGRLKHRQGHALPGSFSPCRTCFDQGGPVLLDRPARFFTYLRDLRDEISEALFMPLLDAEGAALGAIWVLSHHDGRRFDTCDVQVMSRLADFGALALTMASLLAEKDLMLREVDHRVANSLQLTSSLLRLQARRVDEPVAKEQLERAAQRVGSIMQIHQRLAHDTGNNSVDMGAYLQGLCRDLARSVVLDQRDIRLNVHVGQEKTRVPFDRASHIGLLVNELVTNALKHGRAAEDQSVVEVSLETVGNGKLRLAVVDNGPGVPDGFDPSESRGLGMTVVRSMVAQLGGTLRVEAGSGTRMTVEFPELDADEGAIARSGSVAG